MDDVDEGGAEEAVAFGEGEEGGGWFDGGSDHGRRRSRRCGGRRRSPLLVAVRASFRIVPRGGGVFHRITATSNVSLFDIQSSISNNSSGVCKGVQMLHEHPPRRPPHP